MCMIICLSIDRISSFFLLHLNPPDIIAVIGTTVAAIVIVFLCIFLGMCKPVARLLESIPLFVIVLLFGSILLFKGLFTMH